MQGAGKWHCEAMPRSFDLAVSVVLSEHSRYIAASVALLGLDPAIGSMIPDFVENLRKQLWTWKSRP